MSKSVVTLALAVLISGSASVSIPAFAKQPFCKEKIRQYCYEMQRGDPMECVMATEEEWLSYCERLIEAGEDPSPNVGLWCSGNKKCHEEWGQNGEDPANYPSDNPRRNS